MYINIYYWSHLEIVHGSVNVVLGETISLHTDTDLYDI